MRESMDGKTVSLSPSLPLLQQGKIPPSWRRADKTHGHLYVGPLPIHPQPEGGRFRKQADSTHRYNGRDIAGFKKVSASRHPGTVPCIN
mmetsp:Transcript_5702/g.16138  ORF Transcript_5702/g.16138 Transcript_5702/m.16138 type:complete len:89 (+) Transcript_5702:714-980(+)